MTIHRRAFMAKLAGVAPFAYLAGCTPSVKTGMVPGISWPTTLVGGPTQTTVHVPATPRVNANAGESAVNPLPRSAWTQARPNLNDINPMRSVNRITIHHEGSPNLMLTTDRASTLQRLEQIRNFHRHGNGWSDIGYHFIVDRAGLVLEGRPLQFQGAHVKNNNENNIGVMLLGNFNEQLPSQAQLVSMQRSIRDLRQKYSVNLGEIKTHREITATACPGANLQPRIVQMRRQGSFT